MSLADQTSHADTPLQADVLSEDFIASHSPFLDRHRGLVRTLMRLFAIDKVNALHAGSYLKPTGPEVAQGLLDGLEIRLKVNNAGVLDRLPEGAFVTVSNHPFGALDGITLIALLGARRPDFKVMVNMILNYITGMRPNFIAVDALASDDPAKKAVSMQGIRRVMARLRDGHPVGFFPAGAVSKLNGRLQLRDRAWQPSVLRIIEKARVPVIPIYFHGSNSLWFNMLGKISWQLRTLRLPAEVFRKHGKTIEVTIGEPLSVEEQRAHAGEGYGEWLKNSVYCLTKGA